jgi:hypothetical protein
MHAILKETQMRIELQSGRLRLARGQVLKLRDAAGSTVCAVEGSVWITEENLPHDIVLEPRGCYRLNNPGLAIVQTLDGEASLTFS